MVLLKLLLKKKLSKISKEKAKLEKVLGGIKEMNNPPSAIFVIDPRKEYIAVNEARKLNIPIIAVVDTNCNPDVIDFSIPGNDDAIRAISLFVKVVADAVIEGETVAGKRMAETHSMGKVEDEENTEVQVNEGTEEVAQANQDATTEENTNSNDASQESNENSAE